jgi:hypothetical protein
MVKEIYDYIIMGLRSNGCFTTGAPCLNGVPGYIFASSLDHPRSNSIWLLVYDSMHTKSGTPMLYYGSIETMPTLSRRGYYPG